MQISITCCFSPDIPISQFSLRLPSHPVKTGDFFLISIEPHEGTNIVYRWKLDDEEFTKTTKTLFQVYNDPGVYNVQVTASNKNNTVRSSGTIVAQDEIKGLECVKNTAAVVPMEEIGIEWIISQGNSFFACTCSTLGSYGSAWVWEFQHNEIKFALNGILKPLATAFL